MQFKLKPYDWQLKAIEMAAPREEMAVLADMGTGKTGAVVNMLRQWYAQEGRLTRTLILSPLVTLINWKEEFGIHSNIPAHNVHVMTGSSRQKMKTLKKVMDTQPDQIIVTNYETMIAPNIVKEIESWGPEYLVLDEAHMCKNHKAKRSKTIFALSLDTKKRIVMTGTPTPNGLEDIFMIFKILDHGQTFGSNFYVFQRKYMYDENAAWSHQPNHFPKWRIRPEKVEEINQLIYSKAIRVTKDECLDLPPLVQLTHKVQLSPKQKKHYEEMERDFVTFVEEGLNKGIAVAQLAITKALRLQQIVTGFVSDEEGNVIEIKDNPRLKACEELISALHEKHKVIIWCSFRHNYKQLGAMLEKLKVEHRYITGQMSLAQKQEAMNDFNKDDSVRVMVANRRAGGIGVNLVAASYSIIYSRNFSLEEELQSRDRNYRGGSQIHERITKIDLCAEDTIDEHVTKALLEKKEISDRIIDLVRR